MQKNIWAMVAFVIIAAGVIGAGVWYSGQMNAADQQAAVATNATATSTTVTSGGASVTFTTSTPTSTAPTTNSPTQSMDGLQTKDLIVGTGTVAQDGDSVSVLYSGSLDNGTVFDASSLHGNVPFTFTLGAGQVIQGWDMGVVGMKVGGKRELVIPASLGYGATGAGNGSIPPNATLHFTVQLLSVSSTQQ